MAAGGTDPSNDIRSFRGMMRQLSAAPPTLTVWTFRTTLPLDLKERLSQLSTTTIAKGRTSTTALMTTPSTASSPGSPAASTISGVSTTPTSPGTTTTSSTPTSRVNRLPLLSALPSPGLHPNHAHLLTNLHAAHAAHARTPNFERLHDALFCLDYIIKRPPYTSNLVFAPMLETWMVYKDRFLSAENGMIHHGLIGMGDPLHVAVARLVFLLRNVWPEWREGILDRPELQIPPGGRRIDEDLLFKSVMANLVFPMDDGRGAGA